MLSEYLQVGSVIKPQGIRGEVRIYPMTDDPERFLDLDCVWVPEGREYRRLSLEDASVRGGLVHARLDGADSRDAADKQRGLQLYVRRDQAVPLDENRHFISDLIGCRVVDLEGRQIGRLSDVLQPGANDVYVIKTETGRILLPALRRVVPSVDVEKQLITVDSSLFDEVAVIED